MFKINDSFGDFVLNLNDEPKNEYTFSITSRNSNGKPIPWGIELVSDKSIEVKKSLETLIIKFDYEEVIKESFIILKNYKKEFIKITIIPNHSMVNKVYEFKVENINVGENELSFDIISTRNDEDYPWECVYTGEPLSYNISKKNGTGNDHISIKGLVFLTDEIITLFRYRQKKSKREIEITILNNEEGIKKLINVKS